MANTLYIVYNLRVTFGWTYVVAYFSKTEKYFFCIEFISIASTISIFKIQRADSFEFTSIHFTYLKKSP